MSLSVVPSAGLKHAVTEPGDLAEKRSHKSGRTAPSDSECSCETASLSCDSADRPRARPPPVTAQGKNRSRRRGSEWEVLEGLKDGQRFEKRPEVFTGYLHKKRKWPLKGWHKRYFVIDGGILVYARSAGDVSRGRLHGSVDVGLSVISAKSRRRRVDIDADEFIYHLRAKNNEIFRNWLHVLKAHRLYRQHLLTFGTRESAAKIHIPLTELPATENSSNDTLSGYSSSLSTLTSEDSGTRKNKPSTHTATSFDQSIGPHITENEKKYDKAPIESEKTKDDNMISLLNSLLSLNHLSEEKKSNKQPTGKAQFEQFIKPINKSATLFHVKENDKSIKSLIKLKMPDLSPLNIHHLTPHEQRVTELKYNELIRLKRKTLRLRQGEEVSLTNTSITKSACNSSKHYKELHANTDDDWIHSASVTAILSSLASPSINVSVKKSKPSRKKLVLKKNAGLSTFFLFAKHKGNKPQMETDTFMKKSKKCTDVTKYQNSKAESPLLKPFSKCMILGNHHELRRGKFKIKPPKPPIESEIKNDNMSQPKSMTVEEFDNLTDKLVIALFENKVGNMNGSDEENVRMHISRVVKKLTEVTATNESNPVKVMFKTLLEYWLKHTSVERIKSIIENARSVGKLSSNFVNKDEMLSVNFKGSNKSTQVAVIKTRNNIFKYTGNEDKRDNQIQQLEQLLKNTVCFCETMRGTLKDKNIDITKKLIDNLVDISTLESSAIKSDSSPSNNLKELQDSLNNLLSESILPPSIAKEFLCSYLDLLAQKSTKCSISSSQQTIASNKSKSSSSHSSKGLHTNAQTETVNTFVSKSVTTLRTDRVSSDEIKIVNTKDIGIESNLIDTGQQYLKDLLDKLTSMISIIGECQSKYFPIIETTTENEINKDKCNVTVDDKSEPMQHEDLQSESKIHKEPQSAPIKHREVRSEHIEKPRERNPVILKLSEYNLENISVKTDKCNDRAMSITLKLKEKANGINNSNMKLRRAQFWAPKPNPIFSRSHGDKIPQKRRAQKHNRVTKDSKYKPFRNNHETENSHEFSISSSNFCRNTDFIKGSDDPQSCYMMSSFKKTQPVPNKVQMKKIKKVRLKESNGLVISPNIDSSRLPLTPRNRDFTMFHHAPPKVIDDKFILMMFENLVQLATNVPALHKDINGLYIKMKKKYEKGSRYASTSQGLGLLGKIYQEDTNISNTIDTSTQYDPDAIQNNNTDINKNSCNIILKETAVNTCILTVNTCTQVQYVDNIDKSNKNDEKLSLKTLSSRPILVFQPSVIDLKDDLNISNGTNGAENVTTKMNKRLSLKDMVLLRKRMSTNVIKETCVVSPKLSISDINLLSSLNKDDEALTMTSRVLKYTTNFDKKSTERIFNTGVFSTQTNQEKDKEFKEQAIVDEKTLEEINNKKDFKETNVLTLQLLNVVNSKTGKKSNEITLLEGGMNEHEKPRVLSQQLLKKSDSMKTDESHSEYEVATQIRRKSIKDLMLLKKRFIEKIKKPRVLSQDWPSFSDLATTSNSNQDNLINKTCSQIENSAMLEKKNETKDQTDAQTDNNFVVLPITLSNTLPIVSNMLSLKSEDFLGGTLCDVPPFRCKSCSSVSSGTTGPLAGFVTGTPGGKLASWIVETGGPLESASRELGQAQLSIQQLQRVYDALEIHNQIHHDTDASVDGTTSLVKKDRRKFGLRKKKASVKGSSVDLNSQHHNLDVHSGLSALTAPPSPGGGASSLPSSAASLPIACAAARPQSLVEVNSGPGSLTSDHHLREDFLLHAREVLQTLNNVLTTLVNERTRMSNLVASEGGDTMMAALRNNLNTAILQNNELRTRLSRIHDASDIAEISSMGVNSEQCNRALSYSSSCVSASEFYDAEEHRIPAEEIQSGVIELDGDSSSEVGSLSSEDEAGSHGDSSDNSEPALETGVGRWSRRRSLPAPRPPGGPSLWNLLYKNIGKDLSQISMPVTINEPLNMLQRLCEELEYCSILDRAANCSEPLTRAALVATFAVSAYGSAGHRAASKPFNPLLGETYECVREDRGFKFIAEQVSHHPPISACHAESPLWTFWQEARIKTKFWGKSMEFQPAGRVHVKLHNTGDHYSWNKVTTCVHNLFGGQRWVDQYGDMHVVCHTADISAKLSFIKASSWSSSRHEVRGVVSGCGRRVRISGSWTGGLQIGDPPTHETTWRPDPMPPKYEIYYGFTKFAMELNELEPGMKEILPHTDTRLRPDQRALEQGDVESAERFKAELEQAQRDRRGGSAHHEPQWFRKTITDEGEEMWVFNGEYWTSRESGFPALSAPTLW